VDREAVLRRFAALSVRVQGIVHERIPEALRLAAGVDLLGVVLRGDVLALLQRPVAHALVQVDDESRLVSQGDDLAPDLTVERIRRDEVVFRYRGVEVVVSLGKPY